MKNGPSTNLLTLPWVWKIATIYHLLAIKARPAHLRTWGDFDFKQGSPKD